MRFKWYDQDRAGRHPHGDFVQNTISCMRRRAHDVLHPLLSPHGEFLPIKIGKDDAFVYNVLDSLDAVDSERSGWTLNARGARFAIHSYAMDRSRVCGHAFWILGNPVDLFVFSEVQGAVEKNELKGWLFEPVALTTPLYPVGPWCGVPWSPPGSPEGM